MIYRKRQWKWNSLRNTCSLAGQGNQPKETALVAKHLRGLFIPFFGLISSDSQFWYMVIGAWYRLSTYSDIYRTSDIVLWIVSKVHVCKPYPIFRLFHLLTFLVLSRQGWCVHIPFWWLLLIMYMVRSGTFLTFSIRLQLVWKKEENVFFSLYRKKDAGSGNNPYHLLTSIME